VTDFRVNKANVYKLMRGGRARWKIENETFNTLKNRYCSGIPGSHHSLVQNG
jgi:hypothetical protein